MKSRRLLFAFLFTVLTLSCSLPFGAAPAQPTAPPATLPPASLPTDTLPAAPADTPAAEFTATSSTPMVTPSKDPVNCRFGPGTEYESEGPGLAPGASAPIAGKTADGMWWLIPDTSSPGKNCFVSAGVTIASGNLSGIPVAPIPTPFVTDVQLSLKPTSIDGGGGCGGPWKKINFYGKIFVNGPTKVKWYFATEQGGSQSEHTLNFTKYGFQDVTGAYEPSSGPKGKYWVHLIVTFPNSMFAESEYQIKCS